MSNGTDFDSLAYWCNRHDKYMADPRGVGHVSYSEEENARIYAAIDAYIAQLVTVLPVTMPARALDLGCGTGMISDAFIRTGCIYTGVDISPTAVDIARAKHPNGSFLVSNIADLSLAEPFNIIIERTVFIHLVEDGYWRAVLGEVKRLLSPGGVFILMDSLPETTNESPKGGAHVKFRLRSEYAAAFGAVGLKIDDQLREAVARKLKLSPTTHLVTHS